MTRPQFRPPSSDPGTETDTRPARRRATRTTGPPAGESRSRRGDHGSERSRDDRHEDRRGGRTRPDRAGSGHTSGAGRPRSGRPGDQPHSSPAPDADRNRAAAVEETGRDRRGGPRADRARDGGPRSGTQRGTGPSRQSGKGRNGAAPKRTTSGKGGGGPKRTTGSTASAAAEVALWTPPASGMPSFAELGLPARLVDALTAEGFTTPFPVQAATLPDTIAGRDLLGRGQTGSGKTLAFGLALLARLAGDRARPTAPFGLVLVPTRELATQVVEVLKPLAKAVDLRVTDVVGGMSMTKQVAELRRGIDVLVATPGRLADHLEHRTADLSEVTVTVLDEADRMADMGFLPQVRAILDRTPSDGQRLLFSATLDGDVDALVRSHLTDPVTRSVAPATAGVDTMEHHLLVVAKDDRTRVVAEIASREGRTILFVRTKHGADRLVRQLRREGVAAGPLHGGRSQSQRNKALDGFRSGEVPVLVATDVAARGIHIDDVGLVVHVDPPADSKAYLHRAGRTARAGEDGVVVTLVTGDQRAEVDELTRLAGVRPAVAEVRPGHADLVRVTGAREPSGEPIVVAAPPKPRRKPAPAAGGSRAARPRRRR